MIFEAGDIVWLELDPVLGTEQGGRRPAIVLTDRDFNSRNKRSVICPITRNVTPWPTKVILPPGMKTVGAVLTDQIRTVSRDHRVFRFIERAPDDVLEEVKAILGALLHIG
ncbi:mRNA-degrading endonuclease [Brucella endophytica]|uniref:mRNA-degrading endonuclease n=1 Tax=Brucella endophytica TaxID=1963359 RepID=A0A916SGI3_9HYPH|nr:type II toxin-antitoxin system PemK/MazF family toxin [Brucella endophytica]GGA99764.1 mRNA-degrading endonuclease [Brucella endophytica]